MLTRDLADHALSRVPEDVWGLTTTGQIDDRHKHSIADWIGEIDKFIKQGGQSRRERAFVHLVTGDLCLLDNDRQHYIKIKSKQTPIQTHRIVRLYLALSAAMGGKNIDPAIPGGDEAIPDRLNFLINRYFFRIKDMIDYFNIEESERTWYSKLVNRSYTPSKDATVDSSIKRFLEKGIADEWLRTGIGSVGIDDDIITLASDELRISQIDCYRDPEVGKRYGDDEREAVMEGTPYFVLVKRYERGNSRRVYLRHCSKPLCCEVCGMDVGSVYGIDGERLIQVHHIEALSSRKIAKKTKIATDLAAVCPTCHVYLHHFPDSEDALEKARQRLGKLRPMWQSGKTVNPEPSHP